MYRRLKTEGRIHEHPEMNHQLSDSMVRHIHSTLHAALKDAVQAHVIPRNPTEGTTAPKPNYKPKRILTRAEVGCLPRSSGAGRCVAGLLPDRTDDRSAPR